MMYNRPTVWEYRGVADQTNDLDMVELGSFAVVGPA